MNKLLKKTMSIMLSVCIIIGCLPVGYTYAAGSNISEIVEGMSLD